MSFRDFQVVRVSPCRSVALFLPTALFGDRLDERAEPAHFEVRLDWLRVVRCVAEPQSVCVDQALGECRGVRGEKRVVLGRIRPSHRRFLLVVKTEAHRVIFRLRLDLECRPCEHEGFGFL